MPKIVDRKAKKNEIVHAAIGVFARVGYANTKMADIAAEARIGKGTIYEYFKDKNEIFVESFRFFFSEMDTILGRRLYKVTDPIVKLEAFITGWIEVFEHIGSDYIGVMMEFWAEGVRSRHDFNGGDIDMKQMYTDYRMMIKAILDEGVRLNKFKPMNTLLSASILVGALDGLMLQWFLDPSIFSLDEAVEQLQKEFMLGIVQD